MLLKRHRSEPPPADDAVRAAYAAVPYPGDAFPQTHPRSTAAQAALFGLEPAPVERSRILEIGCADGGNAIPIAASLPESEVVAIDLEGEAIERGRELAAAAGVANITLEQGDLAVYEPKGRFDLVIAHGVYSWTPPPVRDRLLALAGACLAPHGVLFLSFNLLPGGHLRALVREVLLRETAGIEDAHERLAAARTTLDRLAAAKAYDGALGEYVARLARAHDALIFHDELSLFNDAVSLGTLARHADRHGLRWLTEARLTNTEGGTSAEGLDLGDGARLDREERLDALTVRMHRQSLLCRRERRIREAPDPSAVAGLFASSPMRVKGRRVKVVELRHPDGGSLRTDHPALIQALMRLGEAFPCAVPVADLPPGAHGGLLAAHARGLVGLVAQAPPLAATPGECPRANALVREQAARDGRVTTGWHTTVQIAEDITRRLLAVLDGARDRAGLAEALDATPQQAGSLGRVLDELAALGLIEGS